MKTIQLVFIGFLVLLVPKPIALGLAETYYSFPRKADDWLIWVTLAGSLGTIIAVVYAAKSFKHSVDARNRDEAQRKTEHQELLGDKHRSARRQAQKLAWDFSVTNILNCRFAEDAQAIAEHHEHEALQAQKRDEGLPTDEDQQPEFEGWEYLYVTVRNKSYEISFDELSLQFLETKQRAKVELIRLRSYLDTEKSSSYFEDSAGTNSDGVIQIQGIGPQEELLIKLKFDDFQDHGVWNKMPEEPLKGVLIFRFRDPEDRYWSRSSQLDPAELYRAWTRKDGLSEAELRSAYTNEG